MTISIRFLLALMAFVISTFAIADNNQYKLSSGDVISIKVFAEPDLSIEEIKLTEQGKFTYPFVGEINAKGLTALQLQNKIKDTLTGDYLVNPRVSVSVLEYRQFYISGEVKEPNGYPYQPGLTIRRAIALAGGMTERASERRITIIRENDPLKKPNYVTLEDLVMPGDSVTIDQGFF